MIDLNVNFEKILKKINNTSPMYSEGIVKKVIGLL